MFCIHCGAKQNIGAKFCQSCGKGISEQKETDGMKKKSRRSLLRSSEHTTSNDLENNHELLRQFVGAKEADFYLQKWSKGNQSWNWAAFFLGVLWLGYRKMFKSIFIMLGIFLLIDVVVALLGINDNYLSSSIGIVVGITLGIWGNHLYKQHAIKSIDSLKERYKETDLLDHEIQLRGGGSWKGVVASFGLIISYIILMMVIVTFIPSINSSEEIQDDETLETSISEEDLQEGIKADIINLVEQNIQSLENEDIEEYMSMIYNSSDSSVYNQTQEMLEEMFDSYDLSYDIGQIEFLSVSDEEVTIRLTQITTLIAGEEFRDNESVFIHTLKPQEGLWKFFETEVETVHYYEEDSVSTPDNGSATYESNYIAFKAPEMFDFFFSEKIDVNNDGTLETVIFNGGPQEGDSYSNGSVEIIVEFEDGGRTPISVVADDAPVLYLYDLDQDGWMELFYETGYRGDTVDLYQFFPDGLEYSTTLVGSIEKFNPYEVITNEDTYFFNDSLELTEDVETETVSISETAASDDVSTEDVVEESSTQEPETENHNLSLDINIEDFTYLFLENYKDNLEKIGYEGHLNGQEFTFDDEGYFNLILNDYVQIIGRYNPDTLVTSVNVISANSIPGIPIEEATVIANQNVCAVYAIINTLGDGDQAEEILQNLKDQQFKEFKDIGQYSSNNIKYVESSTQEETVFSAINVNE
ncbi:DUF2628 domain-containing protein [Paenisporosarcina sp. NPDC076898]|uniref:DUF2628 domain-containing protein n=1 Tax=unclassified Paenisporosarcina TaxID=2642018 RepID=UPI003D03B1B1